jgi:hypothetical protein
MNRYLILLLLLSGCVTDLGLTSSAPSTVVEKIVTKPCIEPKDVPAIPKTAMPPHGDVGQNAAGAAADVITLADLAKRQNDLLIACTPAVPTPPKEKQP